MGAINLAQLLKNRQFLNVATASRDGQPNAAPKFLVKFENPFIYLIDYSFGITVENLKANPRASLSFMDLDNLEGYRLNGPVELIEKGEAFQSLVQEVNERIIKLSAQRVIEGAVKGKRHEHFELEIPDKFIVIKFKIAEATKIGTDGVFYRENDRRKIN